MNAHERALTLKALVFCRLFHATSRGPLNSIGNADARKHSQDSDEYAGQNIGYGTKPLAILKQADSLIGERRKSRKSTKESGGNPDSPFRGDREMGQTVFSEPAKQKAADDIYRQRTVRKPGPRAFLNQSLHGVTRERASCSEQHQQCNPHGCSSRYAIRSRRGASKTKTPGRRGRPGVISPLSSD